MPKFINLTAALSVALIAALWEVTLFQTVADAQEYPGCFMVSQFGRFVDLSNLCPSRKTARESEEPGELNPLVFSALELKQPILNGDLTQVKGVVTNRSNHAVSLSRISFQLVADDRILASSFAEVAARNGLQPGESIKFMKLMKQGNLKGIPLSVIQVKILEYQ